MPCTENTYREASNEHLKKAQDLFDSGSYYLSHYLSGLAIECHLHAWRLHSTKEKGFSSRHDLEQLANESKFFDIIPMKRSEEFSIIFTDINKRWRSDQRFDTEKQVLDYLTKVTRNTDITRSSNSGSRWELFSNHLLGRAYQVIKQGEAKW